MRAPFLPGFFALLLSLATNMAGADGTSLPLSKVRDSAPNVVIILLDDIGFADTSTFGGLAHTPALDQLAAKGLRYNNFNTTAMCSPTRAALLTGRNHHRVGFGRVADWSGESPGYNAVWKKSTASIAEVLKRNGYSTAAFGKWHNTPSEEISPLGPFERWPTGLGFEYFYGFMNPGADDQWEPSSLFRNTTPVEPPRKPAEGYHLTQDITDEAIQWLRTRDSLGAKNPYFLYFATGAVHTPHEVPKSWIDSYRGKFDQGWDKLREDIFERQKKSGVIPVNAELTPRPQEIPAWSSLSPEEQRLHARQMEVFAAFIAHTDHEVGRLLKTVQQGSAGDNTIIFYVVGDNGASAMGGVDTQHGDAAVLAVTPSHQTYLGGVGYPSGYSAGWAWAGSTPFQWMKQVASHFGGLRAPLIVSWPARIKDHGGLREQFTHVNDIAGTIYELAGVQLPTEIDNVAQQPLDGVSFSATFENTDAPSKHHVQYFEMNGNRAIYEKGWFAAARNMVPWIQPYNDDFGRNRWELYHVEEDFSQSHDVASKYPEKLNELRKLFDVEATKNGVYPLNNPDDFGKIFMPGKNSDKNSYTYWPGQPRIPAWIAPDFSRSHVITANVTMPENDAEGIIISCGGRHGGFVLYIKNGHLIYEGGVGNHRDIITSDIPVPKGDVVLTYELEAMQKKDWRIKSSGKGRLSINGKLVGEAQVEQVISIGSLGIGQAFGTPVSSAYQTPFQFEGALSQVQVVFKDVNETALR